MMSLQEVSSRLVYTRGEMFAQRGFPCTRGAVNNDVIRRISDHGLLRYRGKRAGRRCRNKSWTAHTGSDIARGLGNQRIGSAITSRKNHEMTCSWSIPVRA